MKKESAADKRHRISLANRWFKYYKAEKDPKKRENLLRQFNKIAQGRQRDV